MIIKQLSLILAILSLFLLYAQEPCLSLRLEVTKDTVFIGEPMLIKCMIINTGDEMLKVYGAPSRPLLTCGGLAFYLTLPCSKQKFRYGVGYMVLSSQRPTFILESHDSIYWYSILNWRDWTYEIQKKDVSNLPNGTYKISAEYFLFAEDLTKRWIISSNIDSLYAKPMPDDEAQIYDNVQQAMNNYLIFIVGKDEYRTIQEIFPKYVNTSNAVLAMYCHYLLAMSSTLPRRIDLCKSFLMNYPNTTLAEEVEFYLAEAYIGIGRNDLSMQACKKALQKYPDNINGYYYRNLKSKSFE